jgi:peroxiredoxin
MKTKLTAVCVVVVLLLAAVVVRSRFAGEPDPPPAKSAADPAADTALAAELERLGLEYQRLFAARDEAIPFANNDPADMSLSDEEWLQKRRAGEANAPNPNALLPQILAFAQSHSSSPLAFDAIFFIVSSTRFQEFRDEGMPWPVREQALDLAWERHQDDPRMVHLLEDLKIPSRQSESFLKRAIETAPNSAVRAAAGFCLARYYLILAGCHERSQRVKNDSALTNEERFWKLVIAPNLEKFAPPNAEENSKKIDDVLARVVTDYSNVPASKARFSGPSRIFIESESLPSGKTWGDQAASLLFELKNLIPGKPAPDIVGADAEGETLRLSDYRGKVVLLTFSADWCPGCVAHYPLQRTLLEKYHDQPFILLSVSRDEKVDTLKSSIASGEITWRCWWDGRYGPISDAWNVVGAPHYFLLDDQHIIQESGLSVLNSEEEFAQAIEPLLQRVESREKASQ